ncbi:MAG TPA: M55 family metallopeptidase [Candidatus Dormibacteraeota bacterium]|nr:M55 family metallopeptidase [Candidatus Dormibacteraeota bacterium]
MRVLISVDMEGIAGAVTGTDVVPGEIDYQRNRHLMTAEASAAVRGALAFSAAMEVTVSDAHGPFTNILPEELDERARLVRGRPRRLSMMTGVEGADAAIFIGYHGKAGTATSVLSHTINGTCVSDVRCNGRSLGEIGLNAAFAAHHGVPAVMVCGDDTVAAEAAAVIKGVTTVVVKRALGSRTAESLHPSQACRLIEAAVPKALESRGGVEALSFPGPVEVEVDLRRETMAENPLLVPGVSRLGPTTVGGTAPNFHAAYQLIELITILAAVAG